MNALVLGGRRYDLTARTLVMGVLHGPRDSGPDQGAPVPLDVLLRRAGRLAGEGADILELGGVPGGRRPEGKGAEGDQADREAEDLRWLVPAVEALAARFDLPLSVATGRPAVLDAACAAGAACGTDPSGCGGEAFLTTAAGHGAAVIVPWEQAGWAVKAGIPHESVIVDADRGPGGTRARALLLGELPRLAVLGHPLLLTATDQDLPAGTAAATGPGPRWSSLAATAYAVLRGVRIVRVGDVAGTVRVVRTLQALLEPGA